MPLPTFPAGYVETAIVLASFLNACSKVFDRTPSSQSLLLLVASNGPLAAGTYDVPAQVDGGTAPIMPEAAVVFDALDSTCENTSNANASSGSVTLTVVSAAQVEGTFDLMIPRANGMSQPIGGIDHVTGSFVAPYCANLTSLTTPDGGPPTCL
jgi:hypothetical protein